MILLPLFLAPVPSPILPPPPWPRPPLSPSQLPRRQLTALLPPKALTPPHLCCTLSRRSSSCCPSQGRASRARRLSPSPRWYGLASTTVSSSALPPSLVSRARCSFPSPGWHGTAAALFLLTLALRARHSCVGGVEGVALLALSLVAWCGACGSQCRRPPPPLLSVEGTAR